MQEIIEKIMVKESFDESDIKILMQNKHLLTNNHLVRLGFVSDTPPVEPVKVADIQTETTPLVDEPKTRGRKKKIV